MVTTLRWKLLIGIMGGYMTTMRVLLFLICNWMPQFRKFVMFSGTLIPMGFMLIVLSFMTARCEKKPEFLDDERTQKIRAQTYMRAFVFSMTVIVILTVLISLGMLVMNAGSTLLVILIAMALSSSLLYGYYNMQDDINKK